MSDPSSLKRKTRSTGGCGGGKLRPAVSCGEIIEPAADLVNPPHRLAVGREQEYGAVVDDDLDGALVVLDDKLVVLEGSPASGSP